MRLVFFIDYEFYICRIKIILFLNAQNLINKISKEKEQSQF
jgi:hypothetical protein